MKKYFLLLLVFYLPVLQAQYLPVHPVHPVYTFLDEMANEGSLDIVTSVKPYGHKQISQWLKEVNPVVLNTRQLKELAFYQREFNSGGAIPQKHKNGFLHFSDQQRPDMYRYRDTALDISVNPILGGDYYLKQGGKAWHWWNGMEGSMVAGKWVLYGSIRDNHESEKLTQPDYMNQNPGGANFKGAGEGKIDYWEFRGGLGYDFTLGNIGLYKDHFTWGSNYNGASVFSGRTQSFVNVALNLDPVKWFSFRYVHGWLVSEVVDSTESFLVSNSYGTDYREVYHKKYLAANLFTVKPFKGLHFSFGNSIIYDYGNAHPVYFIPFMFYKAVDHHLNSGIDNMNSQMFLDLSVRLIPKTHIYGTVFIDEMATKRIFEPDEYNFLSYKGGIRFDNLLPNFFAGGEFTWSNALTYQHYVSTTTFESNRFNLGHYLEDNARELYAYLGYRPYRTGRLCLSWTKAQKGPDHTLLGTDSRVSIKPLSPIVWESEQYSLQFSTCILNNLYLRCGYTYNHIRGEEEYLVRYTPEFRRGKVHEMNLGLNYGF